MLRSKLILGVIIGFVSTSSIPAQAFPILNRDSNESAIWHVGNGGDSIRLAFQQSKQTASQVVVKIKPGSLGITTSDSIKNWILTNQDKLAADILGSKHVWVESEQTTCARTLPESLSPVHFSFATCRKTIENFNHSVSLLIHESVHHLGELDEEFADQVALAITNAWKAGRTEWVDIQNAPQGRYMHSAVWTGREMIMFGGRTSLDSTSNLNSGYLYNPESQTWTAISKINAPARHGHIAIWTGSKMIIWGGFKTTAGRNSWQNSGAIWDMSSDTWETINPNIPVTGTAEYVEQRIPQTAVWTGKDLMIWGGSELNGGFIGLRYNLASKAWTQISNLNAPMRRYGHTAIWTGSKMIVWGGIDGSNARSDEGASYNPQTDRWTVLSNAGLPDQTDGHTVVWNGKQMLVFGGFHSGLNLKGRGGLYDPSSDSWQTLESEATMARTGHTAVWNGAEMLIFGGKSRRLTTYLNNVSSYDPNTTIWNSKQSENTPTARHMHSAVWTGNSMIVWGGLDENSQALNSGGIYYP